MKNYRWMLAPALCATACGLFPGLSDFVGDGAGARDGAVDAPFDSGSRDGGSDDASPMDATALGDARFCERSDATFCDDFDFSTIAVLWSSVTPGPAGVGNGAVIKNELNDAALSPPRTWNSSARPYMALVTP